MEKLYDRIDWNNNTSPALNDTNLNLMSKAIDDIDDRVCDIAGTVMETVPQIQEDLEEAQDLLEDAEAISTHPPIIGQNGNWWTWDTTIEDYADSGIDAGVSLTIGTTSTLTPGSDATVTNSGTATDPILNFGIPAGVAGQNGQDGADGQDGVSPEVTITTITDGHTVTITDADHPTGQSFNVMDGEDGVGVPSGGTTGQVLKKASGTDYDTEWGTASSGGHTILNGSGSAMNQRSKLQFDGADVVDDGTNDKTIVTGTPQSMIGDAWILGHAYAADNYAIDANGLYKNGTAHTSTATNRPSVNQSGYWTKTSVASELKSLVESDVIYNIFRQGDTACRDGITLSRLTWGTVTFSNGMMVLASTSYNNATRAYFVMSKDLASYIGQGYDLVIDAFYIPTNNSGTWNNRVDYFAVGAVSKTSTPSPFDNTNNKKPKVNFYEKTKIPIDYFMDSTYKFLILAVSPVSEQSVTVYIRNIYIEKRR